MISNMRPLATATPETVGVARGTAATTRQTVSKAAAAAVVAFGLATAGDAQAYEPGDVLVQMLAAGFYPSASGSVPNIGPDVEYDSGGVTANPALNLSYFFTKNIAAQTVLAVPWARVDLDLGGNHIKATDQWVLPLSIIGQYHFFSDEMISPFAGAGFTYAKFWEDQSHLPGGSHVDVDDTWGGLINFGVNVKIPDSRWVAVLDVKKWWLAPADVRAGGNDVNDITLNPWFFGIGIGYNFSTPALF